MRRQRILQRGQALVVGRAARSILSWSAVLALLGVAQLHLHRDGPVRRYLTGAIFPYYIAHQTIIIVVGHALNNYSLRPASEFAIIFAATILGCAATYELARRVPWLRPVFGLRPKDRASGEGGGPIRPPGCAISSTPSSTASAES